MVVIQKRKIYPVLGIDISPYNRTEFFEIIEERFQDDDPSTPPMFVVTVNPEIVVQSIVDPEFRHVLEDSSINTADGVGIQWAVERLYGRKVDRITGADSLVEICGLCAKYEQSVFLYGAMPEVTERAAHSLGQKLPDLKIASFYSPERSDIQLEELPFDTQYYMKSASVIFVALGAPNQEKWIHDNLHKLPKCKLIIGIGGTFDFISGSVKRAPKWVCNLGLEWCYRLIKQPTRWRRMLRLPVFALNVLMLKISDPN